MNYDLILKPRPEVDTYEMSKLLRDIEKHLKDHFVIERRPSTEGVLSKIKLPEIAGVEPPPPAIDLALEKEVIRRGRHPDDLVLLEYFEKNPGRKIKTGELRSNLTGRVSENTIKYGPSRLITAGIIELYPGHARGNFIFRLDPTGDSGIG